MLYDSLDFGLVLVGSSVDTSFTIKNTGGGLLEGEISESCADYEIVSGAGAFSIAAGDSLMVSVRFLPSAAGSLLCTIETGAEVCADVDCRGMAEDVSSVDQAVSLAFGLGQNEPDPFGESTRITFTLDRERIVTLRVYDVEGRLLRTLVDGAAQPGVHRVRWDGRSHLGTRLSSGIYFYRLNSGDLSVTRKAILLR